MKDSLIVSHLVGGASGHNLTLSMTDQEIQATVSSAMRITQEIKRQIPDNADRLMAAHLLGGTSGVDLSKVMTDQEVEKMVHMIARALKEMEKQVV